MAEHTQSWGALQRTFAAALCAERLEQLAKVLGVSEASLQALRVGWAEKGQAWTFPETDYDSRIIGIQRRFLSGTKKVIAGSKRGLYLPSGWREIPGPIFVPEGASDVAALLTRGLCAVGRPSCRGGVEELARLFGGTDRQIVILGENDRKTDGTWPGLDGARETARHLANALGREIRWAMPPEGYKDVREMTRQGGTHAG